MAEKILENMENIYDVIEQKSEYFDIDYGLGIYF
jgi:hypothetical protein